jgi:hypothetical protein
MKAALPNEEPRVPSRKGDITEIAELYVKMPLRAECRPPRRGMRSF